MGQDSFVPPPDLIAKHQGHIRNILTISQHLPTTALISDPPQRQQLKLTLCKQIRNHSGSQQPCRQAPPTLQTERKFPILNFPTSKNRLFETHFIHFKHDLFAFCQIQSRKTHMSQHPLGMNSKTAPDRSPKHAPVPVPVTVSVPAPVNQLWNTR